MTPRDNFDSIDDLRAEIARAIKANHMNMAAFADYAGVSPNTLYNVLSGRKTPRLDTIAVICDALDIELTFKRRPRNG